MSKLLICLQFYPGDQPMAHKLARLMADIEPAHCQQADLMFCGRFDVQHDPTIVQYVARKFNVATFRSRRHGAVGWPYGPNELWFDTMTFIYERLQAGIWAPDRYKAVLCLEADDCPLVGNWIRILSSHWDEMQANWRAQNPGPLSMVGCYLKSPGEHINGNALFSASPEFLSFIAKKGSCDPAQGWDYAMAAQFRSLGWHHSHRIRSYWGLKTMEPGVYDNLVNDGVVLLHGCKDESALNEARERILKQGLRYPPDVHPVIAQADPFLATKAASEAEDPALLETSLPEPAAESLKKEPALVAG